ncbi:molybdopterin guanine dinucleotide synthesis [Albimonas sp. CAU 1670]|uniref:molybdopterin guanine dinucleotide synthesis n=1 Tax=Albimonas sp. CAU 1670 TaxID=3032599 RepID=UPI0023DAFE0A|nr:molybdopterin guanine dinucleotide synthesis [Albimonas sp. CAU 1670]MDF2234019.1 molybdopterin guanine dinucleotide synthesis [Albimonas sp. CAU 1670]
MTKAAGAGMFDAVAMVDWSAANAPSPRRETKDAIWTALARDGRAEDPVYHRTRRGAEAALGETIEAELAAGRRLLIGFDFPFGYPPGVAARIAGRPSALALWERLEAMVEDGPDNRSNRFAVAEALNALWPGVGPFWGRPARAPHAGVPERGRARTEREAHPPKRRRVERTMTRAQPVWKLFTTGSVGSQVLLGLPVLARLRRRFAGRVQAWPFDAGFAAPTAPVVLAEIWPSMLSPAVAARREAGEILDRAQVRVLAEAYSRLDAEGGLAAAFGPPQGLDETDLRLAATEEAWILGVDQRERLDALARRSP